MPSRLAAVLLLCFAPASDFAEEGRKPVRLRGTVLDADSGRPLACRIYIQAEGGECFFPKSESPHGSALTYRKKRDDLAKSVEMHTTLSAHPFVIDLSAGRYTVTVERGKEYFPLTQQVMIGDEAVDESFKLRRWTNLPERGWYSGDTHVHRALEELPNLLLAEDLNVAFPLTYWVTEAFTSPRTATRSNKAGIEPKAIAVDPIHVYYPVNTEYEIFTVNQKAHMLGAVFVLNHKTAFEEGVPPVGPVARRARKESALLELDKHNWPWSMAIVPLMQVDLFELANNHCWRTEFAFGGWAEREARYMNVEREAKGWTEWGWIDFGFQNYYALLDCGFRLRPTAGTASGVHPVPVGFGRVYVHLADGFTYEKWLRGLNEGRSFVTTGPMLFVQVNGQDPGHVFKQPEAMRTYQVTGSAISALPLDRIEIVVNGVVAHKLNPANRRTATGAFESSLDTKIQIDHSSWIAVRCFEDRADKRVRFAHTGPCHVEVAGKPLRPRREEVEYLVQRVEDQITRSADILPKAALDEYREALRSFQEIAKVAR
ncbi:MAG TPA: CehA/McbA family metallohydrolase [Gemmataceae bacterium]|nr:CehA/McbA family metallohydrolase [Gemmataceae bacterium]